MPGIAVVDLETTGLSRKDRIVEVGVVLLDRDGGAEGEFTTLVNPGRHMSGTHIHGISASDVASAPRFEDLSEHLGAMLAGRVVVAHNASFDLPFMAREMSRVGAAFPTRASAVCTMRMSAALLGNIRSLRQVSEYLSIEQLSAHSALDDASVTAEVFRRLVWGIGDPEAVVGSGTFTWDGWSGHLEREDCALSVLLTRARRMWPSYGRTGEAPSVARAHAAAQRQHENARLARLLDHLQPGEPEFAERADYLAMLDAVLADRMVTADEARGVSEYAETIGLTRGDALKTHRAYLARLAHAALLDGVVTDAERADLGTVCTLLALPDSEIDTALAAARTRMAAAADAGLVLHEGDRVCFTGEMSMPRASMENLATSVGLEHGGVCKRTAVLVVADPRTSSGKARKARDYGIPVVAEQVFLHAVERLRRRRALGGHAAA